MSVDEIRVEAQKFQDRIQKRNTREAFAAITTCVLLGFEIYFFDFLSLPVRVAMALFMAASLHLAYQVRKRGSTPRVPADLALFSCIEFHRRELERDRDALQSVWFWGLLPFVPGALVWTIGVYFSSAAGAGMSKFFAAFGFDFVFRTGLVPSLIAAAFFAFLLISAAYANQRAARRRQRRIDELRD